MNHRLSRQLLLTISALFGATIVSLSTARAADIVSWDDLPEKVGHGKQVFTLDFLNGGGREDRSYTVVTTDGQRVRLGAMGLDQEHIWGDGHDIPKKRVSEIRIHHKGRFTDPLTQSLQGGAFLCEHLRDACHPVSLLVVIPVSLGYGVASTIPAIAIEGIRRLLPARVIKVIR